MKTKGNALSVWEVESAIDIDKAVLAMVAAGEHLETIDVVPMNREYLEQKEIIFKKADGLTPVEGWKKNHVNLEELTYKKLGVLAYHIVEKIKGREDKRYTEGKLKNIFAKAVTEGRLEIGDLSEGIRKKLRIHPVETDKVGISVKKVRLKEIWRLLFRRGRISLLF